MEIGRRMDNVIDHSVNGSIWKSTNGPVTELVSNDVWNFMYENQWRHVQNSTTGVSDGVWYGIELNNHKWI